MTTAAKKYYELPQAVRMQKKLAHGISYEIST